MSTNSASEVMLQSAGARDSELRSSSSLLLNCTAKEAPGADSSGSSSFEDDSANNMAWSGKNARHTPPGGVHHALKALQLPLQLTGGTPSLSFTEQEASSQVVKKQFSSAVWKNPRS